MSIDIQPFRDILLRLNTEWDKTERYVKDAEQVSHAVVFPSIKELRYAGRRVVDVLHIILQGGEHEEAMKLLQDAVFDCHRARHDAVDAGTSAISAELYLAVRHLGIDTMLSAFPDYRKTILILEEIQAKIAMSREDRENREKAYADIKENLFPSMIEKYKAFKTSEDVMRALAKKRERQLLTAYMAAAICAVTAVLATVFAVSS